MTGAGHVWRVLSRRTPAVLAASHYRRRRLRAAEGPAPRHPPHATTAFSLVELVISLAILSVGLVGAMRVFPVGLRASQRAETSSRAAIVAQRIIESLKLKAWDELIEGETVSEEDAFEVTTRITAAPALEHLVDPTRLKVIDVTIRSVEGGRPRDLTFITYLRHDSS